jgi:hypothetical protein
MGTIPRSNIALDGRPLGQIGSLTYLYAEVAPGPHRVAATAGDTDELTFDAEAGHNYFVWHQVTMGLLYPGVELHLMSEPEGRKGTEATSVVQPSYREEDLQTLKWRIFTAAFLTNLLGVLPAAGGGATIGIGTFVH